MMNYKWIFAAIGMVLMASFWACGDDDDDDVDYVEQAQKNKEKCERYLRDMKGKKGIMEDPSGLLYEYIEYTSNTKPKLSDTVCVSYTGYTIAGRKFIKKADTLMVEDLQKGLQIGVRHMGEKASYRFYVPYYLAYGASSNTFGKGKDTVQVLSYSALMYEMKLDSIIFVDK